jgi:subtilase family serine protease
MTLGCSLPTGRRQVLSLFVLALATAAFIGSASPARALGTTTTLTNDVVHHLSAARLVGAVPAAQQVTVGVVLSNPNSQAEDAYLAQLYDPNSSLYQQFLDPDTFNQHFGVSATTVQATQSWLSGAGLQVSSVEGATTYLLASGTAAQVSSAFGTPLNTYSAGGRTFYANAVAPAVPASLPIATVLGLNDYAYFVTPRVGTTGTAVTTTAAPTGASVPQTGSLTPQTLWSIYDQPSTNLGNGQTMGIIGWGVTDGVVSDLRSFEQENQLPQVPITTKSYGSTSTPDTSGDGATVEWELDTQASTGMAPDVTGETLYFGHHSTDADILAALTAWVNDRRGPTQASASFGECENIPAAEPAIGVDGLEGPGDALLKQAVIEGRTLFSSTGDTGSSCPIVPVDTNGVATQAYPALNYPSASPYAVAVGGTVLNSDGANPPKRFSETAWEFGGGGNSTAEPAGSYQQGVAPLNCVTDQNGNPYLPGTAPLCRATPDVAAISGDVATGNGMLITDDNGADQQGAGTSLSSPLWLGMWTRIQAAAAKKGLGFANYSLYAIGKSARYANDFFDVTVGDNLPYPAKPGWDNATGWGTPDVAHLMQDLTGRVTPVHNVAPPVPATVAPQVGSGGTLFTDPAGDDLYAVEGQTLAAQGTSPQLDILSGEMALTPDGQTLRTILTIRNLSTVVPTGGVENDYNVVWTFNGVQYFTQLAVEPGGVVQAYDGQIVHASLETRYQQLHVDTGSITPGANGTVEVDVPLANIGAPAAGQLLLRPSAQSYVREGVLAGSLEPIDSAGPNADFVR